MQIILTSEQAEAVRGETAPGAYLDPKPLKDGSFALSSSAIQDTAHLSKIGMLVPLPQREVADHEWAGAPDLTPEPVLVKEDPPLTPTLNRKVIVRGIVYLAFAAVAGYDFVAHFFK